jgi:uncharacterized protein with PIN domain
VSCKACKLGHYDELYGLTHCDILRECMPYEGRHKACPLKLVEENAFEKQIPKKVITTPDKHKYGYCPVCGRIYWDKCHVGNYCDQCGQRLEVERNG